MLELGAYLLLTKEQEEEGEAFVGTRGKFEGAPKSPMKEKATLVA